MSAIALRDDAGADPAERSLLGALLVDGSLLSRVNGLRSDDFLREAHGAIFTAMRALAGRGEGIDLTTVSCELEKTGRLERAGGAAGLSALVDRVPNVENVESYARIVREESRRRRLLAVLDKQRAALAAGARVDDVAANVVRSLETEPAATAPAPSVTVSLADVQPERVSWLWEARIPLGKVTLFDGDPGLGKSTLALEVAARLTTGRALPEGEAVGPWNVVILTAEDGLADTIRPRLDAAGADVNRVFALTAARAENGEETFPTLDGNLPALADAVRRHEARLVIVDPLMAFLGGAVNSWRDQDVRRVLAPLAKLAEETGAAVVVIRHLTKGGGTNAVYRGGGSIGIAGAARSILLVAKDPEDEGRRIIASAKSNLSIPPSSLVYRLESAGLACRIAFDGTSALTADGLLAAAAVDEEPDGRSARDDAGAFLSDRLSNGPVPAPDVQKAARQAGHAWRTVRRAKDALGIVVEKCGMTGGWVWRLPAEGGQSEPKASTQIVWPSSGGVGHLREKDPQADDLAEALSDDEKETVRTAAALARRIVP